MRTAIYMEGTDAKIGGTIEFRFSTEDKGFVDVENE